MDCSTCRVWTTVPEKRAARVCAACRKAGARSAREAGPDDPIPAFEWRVAPAIH